MDLQVPQIVFVSVLCASIIVGNLCVLWAVRLADSGRQTRMNFFILHLAVADLLVGVTVSFTDLMSIVTVEWYAGNVMCKLVQFLQATVTYSSTFILVSLSIDRYDAVARPMNFSRSGIQARILIGMAWGAAVLFAMPTLFLYHEEVRQGKPQCWLDFPEFWHWQLFLSVIAVVTFFIPTLIIASCYIAIIHIIWSKGRARKSTRSDGQGQGSGSTETRLTISDSRHTSANGIIPQAKIRTIKMTLIIVIVFILCWSPYFVYNLLDLFGNIEPNTRLATFMQSAAPLNSAANPVIYGIFSTRICRNLRRLTMNPCIRKTICRCADANRGSYRRNFRTKHYPKYSNHLNIHQTGGSHTDPTMYTLDASRRHNSSLHHSSRTRAVPLIVNTNDIGHTTSTTSVNSRHNLDDCADSDSIILCPYQTRKNGSKPEKDLRKEIQHSYFSSPASTTRKDTTTNRMMKPASKSVRLEVTVYDVGTELKSTDTPKLMSSEQKTDDSIIGEDGTSVYDHKVNIVEALTESPEDLGHEADHNELPMYAFNNEDEALSSADMEKSTTLLLGQNETEEERENNENALFKSIASRRPSGLPVVRKTLTANENMILRHVTAGLPVPSTTE